MLARVYLSLTDLKILQSTFQTSQNSTATPYDTRNEDVNMRRFLFEASRLFDQEVNKRSSRRRSFVPVYETRYFDADVVDYPRPGNVDILDSGGIALAPAATRSALELYLRDDLLAVDTFTTKNGQTSLSTSDYWLMRRHDAQRHRTPYDMVRLKENGAVDSFEYDTDPVQAHAITGWWGYHEDWTNAWGDSGDSVQDGGGINATVTTVTVSNVDGLDRYGTKYRFKELQLIRIGTEYMLVTAVDVEANTLTVVRGVNGTTAATHANDAQIDIYEPMDEIRTAIWAWALHLLRRKDSVGKEGEMTRISDRGDIFVPHAMPGEVKQIAANYNTARL